MNCSRYIYISKYVVDVGSYAPGYIIGSTDVYTLKVRTKQLNVHIIYTVLPMESMWSQVLPRPHASQTIQFYVCFDHCHPIELTKILDGMMMATFKGALYW